MVAGQGTREQHAQQREGDDAQEGQDGDDEVEAAVLGDVGAGARVPYVFDGAESRRRRIRGVAQLVEAILGLPVGRHPGRKRESFCLPSQSFLFGVVFNTGRFQFIGRKVVEK